MPDPKTTPATVMPALKYRDAPAAIEWLERAFGFKSHMTVPGPDNTVAHAQMTSGNGMIMLGSTGRPDPKNPWSDARHGIYVVVADVDAHYARAKAAGAEIVMELRDTDYGSRGLLRARSGRQSVVLRHLPAVRRGAGEEVAQRCGHRRNRHFAFQQAHKRRIHELVLVWNVQTNNPLALLQVTSEPLDSRLRWAFSMTKISSTSPGVPMTDSRRHGSGQRTTPTRPDSRRTPAPRWGYAGGSGCKGIRLASPNYRPQPDTAAARAARRPGLGREGHAGGAEETGVEAPGDPAQPRHALGGDASRAPGVLQRAALHRDGDASCRAVDRGRVHRAAVGAGREETLGDGEDRRGRFPGEHRRRDVLPTPLDRAAQNLGGADPR